MEHARCAMQRQSLLSGGQKSLPRTPAFVHICLLVLRQTHPSACSHASGSGVNELRRFECQAFFREGVALPRLVRGLRRSPLLARFGHLSVCLTRKASHSLFASSMEGTSSIMYYLSESIPSLHFTSLWVQGACQAPRAERRTTTYYRLLYNTIMYNVL